MQFVSIIALGLFGLASAAPSLSSRDLATIVTDFENIQSQVEAIDSKVQVYTGTALQSLSLFAAVLTLENDLTTTTNDITSNGVLSAADSATLYAAGSDAIGELDTVLQDIIAKVPVIESSGFESEIGPVLSTVKSDADALFAALEANIDPSYTDELEKLEATVSADYAALTSALGED